MAATHRAHRRANRRECSRKERLHPINCFRSMHTHAKLLFTVYDIELAFLLKLLQTIFLPKCKESLLIVNVCMLPSQAHFIVT